jgi:hypothetical protein
VGKDRGIVVNRVVARGFAEVYAGDLVVLLVMRRRSLGLSRHSEERADENHKQSKPRLQRRIS